MPLQPWEVAQFLGPPPGSGGPGAASGVGGGSGGFDAFALPGSSGRGRGSGSASTTGGRGRGGRRGRGRGPSSRAGPAGGRGRLPPASRAAATPTSGASTDDFALNSPRAQSQSRQSVQAPYYPRKPKSGPASILVQLLLFEGQGISNPDIKTLQAQAQRFCDDPMVALAGPHNTANTMYGAWASMKKTLEPKGLVHRTTSGRKHTFSLLPGGREIASRLLRENRKLYTGSSPSNAHSGRGGGGGGGNGGSGGGSSSSPNPFSPPRRSGGPGRNLARKSDFSPVPNPYTGSGGISSGSSRNGGGIDRSGGGRHDGLENPAGVAAEARRLKEFASKAAGPAAAAAATTSVGTSRGRALQERGKEKHTKRAKLYEATTPGSQCYHRGLAPSPDAESPLLAVLKQCGRAGKNTGSSGGAKTTATAAAAVAGADSASSRDRNERDGGDGGGGSGVGGADLGMADDDWMALTSRPAKKSSPLMKPSSAPLRKLRASSNLSKTTLGASKGKGAPSVLRSAPSRAPGPAILSAGSGGNERQGRRTAPDSLAAAAAAAGGAVGDVVDISLSDDEQNDDDHDDGDVVMTPPPDRRAGAVSSSRSRSSSGDDIARAPGPGDGGVVPLVSPNFFRSTARVPSTVVDPSGNGAMDWRGRACPAWLQRELDTGTLTLADRMVDAFDLVLIADCAEQEESMREVRTELERSLSQQSFSLSRAGLGVTPSSGMGLELQVAKLQVGDFAWAWRRRRTGTGARGTPIASGAQEEVLLLDCIVERKSDHDIVGSIEGLGNRYQKQKRRMKLSGLSRLIYLLEGELAGFVKPTTGEDKSKTIRTMEVDTMIQGFVMKRVQNTQETAAFLLSLSLQLMGSQGTETIKEFCANPSRPKVSFREWNTALTPSNFEPPTVNLQFAKCLRMVDRLGPEAALVIAREFDTPKLFFDALRQCGNLQEQLDLVKNLKLSDGGKKASVQTVGPTAAGKLVALFAQKTACLAAR